MKNKSRFMLVSVILSFGIFIPVILHAGTTGKITGAIVDAETGEKLPGANVLIANTPLGAATDVQGQFFIVGVPPGLYTLRFSMMGYITQILENVRVSIDLTTPVNAKLTSTVLTGEEVTIIAERPLVQKDMTSSLSSVNASEIRALPVQEVNDVLELQAGIVRGANNELHIKGGRAGEVAYWVDGVATTDQFSGNNGVRVETAAIQELQLISGTFNAEYGQAMSGIINIITKEGTKNYTGQFRGYVGDYVSNGDEFSVLSAVKTIKDLKTGNIDAIGQKSYPLQKFNPNYNGEATLSGPVPFSGDKLTFFFNGRYLADEGYLYGRRWFTPQNNAGDRALVPMNPYTRTSLQGKLTYNLSANVKVNYNVFWNAWKNERIYNQNYKYVPDGVPQGLGDNTTHIFALSHVLSPSTFYEVRVNHFFNEYKQYVYKDPLATCKYLVWVYPDTAAKIPGYQLDPSKAVDLLKLDQVKAARGRFVYFPDPKGPAGYVHPDSAAAPATNSFYDSGMNMGHYHQSTAYWVGKFDFSSQLNQVNQFKAGFELRMHDLALTNYSIQPRIEAGSNNQITPFVPAIPADSTEYYTHYNRKPREFSAYVQDKLELKDIIMNIGLRFDYFDANSVVPVDPENPDLYYTALAYKYKYANWVDPPAGYSQAQIAEYIKQFRKNTPEERRALMQKKVDSKMKFSPRLGIAYPITDKGVIHFSYGHFFQIPEFQYLYADPDFKLPASGAVVMGNANLHPQKTILYEIGLQQQLTRDLGIDVTLFYRDVRDWVGTSPKIIVGQGVQYYTYENKDYENVRGFTLKVEKRYSYNFSARMDYTYQVVEGTYSNPNDAFNADQAQQEPRLALIPMAWDQRHTLNGSIIYQWQKWTVSLIGRFWSGRPYTPSFPKAAVVGGQLIGLQENSSRLPSQKSVDLYFNRRIDMAGLAWDIYLNIYNLFDQRDQVNVYSDTGTAEYTTNITPTDYGYDPKRVGTIEDFVNQPGWYTAPRQVQIGLAVNF